MRGRATLFVGPFGLSGFRVIGIAPVRDNSREETARDTDRLHNMASPTSR
jgi:hypothetical protein